MKSKSTVYTVLIGLSTALFVYGWLLGKDTEYLLADNVEIAQVKKGNWRASVKGYGQLESLNQRLLTSTSIAVVDQIVLKPGDRVSADDVILRLKNPALETQLQKAQTQLQNAKLQQQKVSLEQQRELLAQESVLAEAEAEAQIAQLQVEAEQPLAKKGIVSAMDFKRSQLNAKQLQRRFNLESIKFSKLQAIHQGHQEILVEEFKQARNEYTSVEKQVDQLQVKAGMSGVLLRLPVTLGQSVLVGAELALVGSTSPLIAKINVPHTLANTVFVGAQANIDTRHGLVTGEVLRIDPVVKDGTVQVEIHLPEDLSKDIRPMQVVDATIYGKSKGDLAFVKKPTDARAGKVIDVFKMTGDMQAEKVTVTFGKTVNNMIEVVSGLSPGDAILVSAPTIEQNITSIKLKKS